MTALTPNLHVFVDGVKVKSTSVSVKTESGLQRLETLDSEVFYSQATKMVTVTNNEPLLPDGPPTDVLDRIWETRKAEMQIVFGSKRYFFDGVFLDHSMDQSSASPAEIGWTFEGKMTKVQ